MVGASDSFEIKKVIACPGEGLDITFGVTFAFLDAWDGFGEGFATGFAPQATFTDDERGTVAADRSVFHPDQAMVIGGGAWCGTFGAVLGLREFSAFVAGVKAVLLDDPKKF